MECSAVKYNRKTRIMNTKTFRKTLAFLPIFAISTLFSCSDIDVQESENIKDEIIDSLTVMVDSLLNEHEEQDKMAPVLPEGIVILNKEVMVRNGSAAEIHFRVNPSNADVDLNCFQLDSPGAHTKAISYITAPTYVRMKSVRLATENHIPLRGQYVMTIEDRAVSEEYTEDIAVVYASKNAEGRLFEISSDVITVRSAPVSDLPKVYVNTPGGAGITSKTEWVEGSTISIIENGIETLNMGTSIRGRGNSTWGYPKKPYALKLDSKAEVMGMPKHKRWVLLANWMDRTLMRNDVAFEMGRQVMAWAPRGEFVELYLNGKHQGNYYLCEQIKPDENRVNVDDDGYILEFDTYGPSDEINYYYTPIKNYPVTIKEPDEEVITSWEHEKFLYISDYTGDLERLLEEDKDNHTRWSEVEEMIDATSYVDWWLIHELAFNGEPNHPKSSYMHKPAGGKLTAGPVWDFDWATFTPSWADSIIGNALWYGYLFRYPEFRAIVKERWAETKDIYQSMDAYIEETADRIRISNEANINKWPISSNVNGDEKMTFDQAVERMRTEYKNRIEAIDRYTSQL